MAETGPNAYTKLEKLRSMLLTEAAAVGAYHWGEEFSYRTIRCEWNLKRPVWEDVERISVQELQAMPFSQLKNFGFAPWGDNTKLLLIPLWAWNLIKDGEVLTSINKEDKTKGIDDIDLDHRFGNIAWGFMHPEIDPDLV